MNKHALAGLLRHDPVQWLLSAQDQAVTALVKRDLLGQEVNIVEKLWDLPEVRRILRRQQANGSWRYPVEKPSPYNYDLYATFDTLGILVGISTVSIVAIRPSSRPLPTSSRARPRRATTAGSTGTNQRTRIPRL
jgi:hypothetical protein